MESTIAIAGEGVLRELFQMHKQASPAKMALCFDNCFRIKNNECENFDPVPSSLLLLLSQTIAPLLNFLAHSQQAIYKLRVGITSLGVISAV